MRAARVSGQVVCETHCDVCKTAGRTDLRPPHLCPCTEGPLPSGTLTCALGKRRKQVPGTLGSTKRPARNFLEQHHQVAACLGMLTEAPSARAQGFTPSCAEGAARGPAVQSLVFPGLGFETAVGQHGPAVSEVRGQSQGTRAACPAFCVVGSKDRHRPLGGS